MDDLDNAHNIWLKDLQQRRQTRHLSLVNPIHFIPSTSSKMLHASSCETIGLLDHHIFRTIKSLFVFNSLFVFCSIRPMLPASSSGPAFQAVNTFHLRPGQDPPPLQPQAVYTYGRGESFSQVDFDVSHNLRTPFRIRTWALWLEPAGATQTILVMVA